MHEVETKSSRGTPFILHVLSWHDICRNHFCASVLVHFTLHEEQKIVGHCTVICCLFKVMLLSLLFQYLSIKALLSYLPCTFTFFITMVLKYNFSYYIEAKMRTICKAL